MIRPAAVAVTALVLSPVVIGCMACIVGSFGGLEGSSWSMGGWQALATEPGLLKSISLSIVSGTAGALLAVAAAIVITAALHDRPAYRWLLWLTPPLLAVPHLVTAVGMLMVSSPSGVLMRLVAPWLGWSRPPDWPVPQDPWGIGLTLGLACRETPFVLFVLAAVTDRRALAPQLAAARALGRTALSAWLQIALPQLYPRIRLPVLAVLVYGFGNVDMAMILGPTAPAPLAVRVLHWFSDADLDRRPQAFAGASLLLLSTAVIFLAWRSLEALWLERRRQDGRLLGDVPLLGIGKVCAGLVMGILLASLSVLALWSVAEVWRFPAPWPTVLGLSPWMTTVPSLLEPFLTTLALGAVAAAIAVLLTLAAVDISGPRRAGGDRLIGAIIWLPLVVPQLAFAFGAQILWIGLGLGETVMALLWAHLMMVLPYVALTLAGPLERFEPRWVEAGRSLGHGAWSVWRRVVLPALLRPILAAAAIGFAVSCAQYVLTMAAGGGRFATLATETMALAGGGDRRRIGVSGLTLALLPFAAMLAALAIPALLDRWRQIGSGANRLSMSSSLKLRPAPPPPRTPS